MAITTTSTLPSPVQQSFSYKLLSVPVPNMIHNVFAMKKAMPANGGNTIRFRRYNPLNTAMVPLGNSGVTPPAQNLTALDIDARISFYGTYVILNEQVTLQNQDPVLNECAARLGVSLRQTEDQLTRDMLAASAAFINCTGGVNGDTPTEVTRPDIQLVYQTLSGYNAYMISDNIEGEDKFGTQPIRRAFWGMCNTALMSSLENVDGFVNADSYPAPNRALESEWGSVGNCRFLLSSIGSFFPNASVLGNTVYNIFVTGLEAYASVHQDQYSATFIYRPPIYDGPLALNASVGYKFAQVPRLLNDQWIINLRATIV